jgi:hypothetical protein
VDSPFDGPVRLAAENPPHTFCVAGDAEHVQVTLSAPGAVPVTRALKFAVCPPRRLLLSVLRLTITPALATPAAKHSSNKKTRAGKIL